MRRARGIGWFASAAFAGDQSGTSDEADRERLAMTDSRLLASVIGPTLIALGATEALNMDIFAAQIAPVVYLNGAILFVSGLGLVRAHNIWALKWPVIVTLTGWIALVAGLYRMTAPRAPQASENVLTYAMLAAIAVMGIVLSYKGYGPRDAE
jgi:hypothetical protein